MYKNTTHCQRLNQWLLTSLVCEPLLMFSFQISALLSDSPNFPLKPLTWFQITVQASKSNKKLFRLLIKAFFSDFLINHLVTLDVSGGPLMRPDPRVAE